jgi:glyoxylase-like metal-dependent hydrolase (beta-lactamase superfamily II)
MPGTTAHDLPRLHVERFGCGPLGNNVYVLTAAGSQEAIVVDPALGATEVVLPALRERHLRPVLIVATHAHWDHVAEAHAMAEATGATVAAHRLDAELISRPGHPMMFPELEIPPASVGRELYEGDTIELEGVELAVLHTPGHSPGSICLYAAAEATLLSGDTLFAGSFGRYDLPGGDVRLLRASLQRLAQLPPETRVLPGHGEPTTIGEEAWLRRELA